MRKMRLKVGFRLSAVLSLALVVTGLLRSGINANAGSVVNPKKGSITYITADLFDYDATLRCVENGYWVVNGNEYDNDSNLITFNYIDLEKLGLGQIDTSSFPVASKFNAWTDLSQSNITKGLVESKLNDSGLITLANGRVAVSNSEKVTLFNKGDANHFVGSYNLPLENTGDGYLVFDSSKNHVSITNEVAGNGNFAMNRTSDGVVSEDGFAPFNTIDVAAGAKKSEDGNSYYKLAGEKNYNFGMSLKVPFDMTEDGKITLFDGSKEDMVFDFISDDDLWVFVDGNLIVDLGGVHDPVAGCMNFADGSVYTCGCHYSENGEYVVDADAEYNYSSYLKSLEVGEHEIEIFYLQRGEGSEFRIQMRLQDAIGEAEISADDSEKHKKCTEKNEDPAETEVPVVTEAPVQTEAPVVTEAPVQTEEPAQTKTPVETEAPVATEAPVVTEAPAQTEAPAETVAPIATKAPVVATETEESEIIPTEEPVNVIPAATKTPDEKKESKSEVKDVFVIDEPILPGGSITATDKDTTTTEKAISAKVNKNSKVSGDANFSDNPTPLAVLPKTGTLAEEVFYILGALLIIGGLFVTFIPERNKQNGR